MTPEHEAQIQALIERDAYFMPLSMLTKKDRDLIQAMYAENKRLREALEKMLKKYGGMYDEWQEVELEANQALKGGAE